MANPYLDAYRDGKTYSSPSGGSSGPSNSYLSKYRKSLSTARSSQEEEERRRKKREEEAKARREKLRTQGMVQRKDKGFDFYDPDSGDKIDIDSYVSKKNLIKDALVKQLASRGDPVSKNKVMYSGMSGDTFGRYMRAQNPEKEKGYEFKPKEDTSPIQRQEPKTKGQQFQSSMAGTRVDPKPRNEDKAAQIVSFLDSKVDTETGTIRGKDMPTNFNGQQTTFDQMIQEFNSQDRYGQDRIIKTLEDTIRGNQRDFGDEETAKIRDDAILQKLILEQRGEWKNPGLKSTIVGGAQDMYDTLIEDTTAQGQMINEAISRSIGVLAGDDSGYVDKMASNWKQMLDAGKISQREYAQQMNVLYNSLEPLVGSGVDAGALDRLLRLVGSIASVEGTVVPMRTIGKGAAAAISKGSVKAIGKEAALNAAENAAVSSLATLQREGINTDVSQAALAFAAGGAMGAGISLVGSGIGVGIRRIAAKIRNGKQLTEAETARINDFAESKMPEEVKKPATPKVRKPKKSTEVVAKKEKLPTTEKKSEPTATPTQKTPLEALRQEANKYGADIEFVNRKPTKKERVHGRYRDGKIVVFTKGVDGKPRSQADIEKTLMHEIGHAFDYKRRGIVADPMGDSIRGFDGKLRPSRDSDIYFRDSRLQEAQNIRQLAPRTDGAATTQKEVYADAFRLYKTQPKDLEQAAPTIYKELDDYFKSDSTPTAKEFSEAAQSPQTPQPKPAPVDTPQVGKTPSKPPKAKVETYRSQPKDVKKAIDHIVAQNNPEIGYEDIFGPAADFPDGIPQMRPQDVRQIMGMSPREYGIPPRYVSKKAMPLDKQAIDYEMGIRGNTTGELTMTSEDYFNKVMDAIEANRTGKSVLDRIAKLRNDPDIIKQAKDTLAAEKARYAPPEVEQPTKRSEKEYRKRQSKKVFGARDSAVYERLRQEYEFLQGDQMYQSTTLKAEALKAVKLLEEDKQAAYRIAMGADKSDELTQTAMNIAMVERALNEGNDELASKLIINRSLAQTRRGQEIVMEKGSVTNNSTSRYVKELIQSRMSKVKEPLGMPKLGKSKLKVTDIIDAEAKKIEKQVKFKELDVKKAQDFIDGLVCK